MLTEVMISALVTIIDIVFMSIMLCRMRGKGLKVIAAPLLVLAPLLTAFTVYANVKVSDLNTLLCSVFAFSILFYLSMRRLKNSLKRTVQDLFIVYCIFLFVEYMVGAPAYLIFMDNNPITYYVPVVMFVIFAILCKINITPFYQFVRTFKAGVICFSVCFFALAWLLLYNYKAYRIIPVLLGICVAISFTFLAFAFVSYYRHCRRSLLSNAYDRINAAVLRQVQMQETAYKQAVDIGAGIVASTDAGNRPKKMMEYFNAMSRSSAPYSAVLDHPDKVLAGLLLDQILNYADLDTHVVIEDTGGMSGASPEVLYKVLSNLFAAAAASAQDNYLGLGMDQEDGRLMLTLSYHHPKVPVAELMEYFSRPRHTSRAERKASLYYTKNLVLAENGTVTAENVPDISGKNCIQFKLVI